MRDAREWGGGRRSPIGPEGEGKEEGKDQKTISLQKGTARGRGKSLTKRREGTKRVWRWSEGVTGPERRAEKNEEESRPHLNLERIKGKKLTKRRCVGRDSGVSSRRETSGGEKGAKNGQKPTR